LKYAAYEIKGMNDELKDGQTNSVDNEQLNK
jgi:hypothetical protein